MEYVLKLILGYMVDTSFCTTLKNINKHFAPSSIFFPATSRNGFTRYFKSWISNIMASLITKRLSVLPSLGKCLLQKSTSKSLSSTSFLLQKAKVQHPAPEFKGQAVVNGAFKEVSLSDFKGKWLVLFFYPLDFTFVSIFSLYRISVYSFCGN